MLDTGILCKEDIVESEISLNEEREELINQKLLQEAKHALKAINNLQGTSHEGKFAEIESSSGMHKVKCEFSNKRGFEVTYSSGFITALGV